jgi:hypothetical protein
VASYIMRSLTKIGGTAPNLLASIESVQHTVFSIGSVFLSHWTQKL